MSGRGPWTTVGPRPPRGPLAGLPPAGDPPATVGSWGRLRELTGGLRAAGSRTVEPRLPVPQLGSRTLATPIRLIVVLDESGSTSTTDPGKSSHQALLELCDWLTVYSGEPRDRIGAVRFADRAATIDPVRAAGSHDALLQQLAAPAEVGGGTQLTPAIEALTTLLRRRANDRRIAVLITDGQVAETDDQLRSLFNSVRAVSDAIYLVALDHDGTWTRSTHRRYTLLPLTGITVLGTPSRAHLAHAVTQLLMHETGLVPARTWRRQRR